MKVSKGSLVLTAAFTGLLGGTMTRLNASTVSSTSTGQRVSSSNSLAGQSSGTIWEAKKEKHACKGQNSCKGKGGCKTSDNGCKAKNSCKGKGGCATDGSMKKTTWSGVASWRCGADPGQTPWSARVPVDPLFVRFRGSAPQPRPFPNKCLQIDSTGSPITVSV